MPYDLTIDGILTYLFIIRIDVIMLQNIPQFFTFLLNGILIGGMYSLFALGLAVIYGVFKVMNFAHGEFYMLGGYVAYFMWSFFGLPNLIGIFASVGVMMLLGVVLERAFVTPMYEKGGEMYALIITFALSSILWTSALLAFGPFHKALPYIFPGSVNIMGVIVGLDRLASFTAAVVAVALFWIFIFRTSYGKAIRAVAHDKDVAALMGVNTDRIQMLTFGLAAGLAGAAGVLLSTTLILDPEIGQVLIIKAFIILVLGGMGSMRGALVGGILLGVTEALGSAYISTAYGGAFGFILLIVILVIRPSGIFGYEMK